MMPWKVQILLISSALSLAGCSDLAESPQRLPPIMEAVAGGDTARTRALLDQGVDPNFTGEYGYTTLAYAVRVHETISVRQRRRVDEGLEGPPEENTEILELLLARGADPNQETPSGTPLTIAIYQGLTQSVRILLENGVDPNGIPGKAFSPLILATFHCYPDIAQILIDHGAEIGIQNFYGKTARSVAEEEDCPEIVELIDRQADTSG